MASNSQELFDLILSTMLGVVQLTFGELFINSEVLRTLFYSSKVTYNRASLYKKGCALCHHLLLNAMASGVKLIQCFLLAPTFVRLVILLPPLFHHSLICSIDVASLLPISH